MSDDLTGQLVMRWRDGVSTAAMKSAGVTAVVGPARENLRTECTAAGLTFVPEPALPEMKLEAALKSPPSGNAAISDGLWPGIQRQDAQRAGATGGVWLDQNCGLIEFLRAARLPRVLTYDKPKDAPVQGYELALVDAMVSGGAYVLPAEALGVETLGRTARWLKENARYFAEPPLPLLTILADGDMSREIASLAFRYSASPRIALVSDPPGQCRVLSAVTLERPDARAVLAQARAGATVVVDKNWWRVQGLQLERKDGERDFYKLGKGRVVAYRDEIEDPNSVALDLIDIVTQKERSARVFNLNAGLAIARGASLTVVNYSARQSGFPVLARIHGSYRSATLLRPEASPVELRVAPRASGSEVEIPRLERVALVVFK